METLSGFTSEASLRYSAPNTPPYTPHRMKRRLSRSDSPASIRSTIPPTETTSPTKKPPKRRVLDEVRVEELTEADLGYIADIEVVYPHELEEAESQSEDERGPELDNAGTSLHDDSDSHDSVAEQLSRLGCDDQAEASFERKRKEKHARRRAESRIYKRPHSLIVNPDAEITDLEALPDHDLPGSARRLRRRTRGPDELVGVPSDGAVSSPESTVLPPSAGSKRGHDGKGTPPTSTPPAADDEMDVDESKW